MIIGNNNPKFSNDIWWKIFNSINDAISITSKEGNILFCNKAMGKLVGRPIQAIIDENYESLFEKFSYLEESYPQISSLSSRRRETRILKNGRIWINCIIDPIVDKESGITNLIHIITDITDLKEIISLILNAGKIEQGQHLCAFYNSQISQFSCVVPYIIAGLRENEKCFYILDENTENDLIKAFNDFDFDISSYIKSKQFVFYTKKETYLKDGSFESKKMIDLIKATEIKSLKDGYSGVRITGEMTWALSGPDVDEKLFEYENLLNTYFAQSKCSAICQYNEKRFIEKFLIDATVAHPKVILNGLIYKNNYYLSLEKLIKGARNNLNKINFSTIKKEITKTIFT